jgi:uncharacterized repeat protein (TIGR03806 family)
MKLPVCLPRYTLIGLILAIVSFPLLIWLSSGFAQVQAPSNGREGRAATRPISNAAFNKRPHWTTSRIAGTPEPPAPYSIELAFPHLKFENPLALVRGSGTSRLFVGDIKGRVWSFPEDRNCKQAELALDVSKHHADFTALYGLALHPRFDENRYIYICYVLANNLEDGSRVSRFQVSRTDPPVIDPKSEKVIIRFWSGGHNGGCLDFGNDGYLYISTGDGADPSPPDSKMTGQDCSDLLSSILRIDVDHAEPGKNYRVPADNPFVKTSGVRPEIWAFGLRNPWRMSIDRATGDLWVGDVGWELWEMIYRVERGGNYGWSVMEGPQPVRVDGKRGPTPILPPMIAHPHSEAASITGGYVYHGSRLPELAGAYIYGDYQTGTVWGLRHDGKSATWRQELARTPLHLAAFGESNTHELYLIDHDRTHQIYRLIPNREAKRKTDFPRRLRETGLFRSTRDHQRAPGVVPYAVNVELWSDGAKAERFMGVPGNGLIALDEQGNWKLPEGSVLARTVTVELEKGKPASRRIETQVLHFEAESWRPYTYVWSDDQSDAVLADAKGSSLKLDLTDPESPGGHRTVDYRIYAQSECTLCHNPWVEKKTTIFGRQSASPLGLNTLELNRDCTYGDVSLNQLVALHQMGLLAWTPVPEKLPHLTNPYDDSADLELRARSYFQVNCSHCHQFNAGGAANIALGFEVPLDKTKTVGVRPIQGTFNITEACIIAPGDPAGSVLYYRISKLGGGRMPRVGSNQVDERATRLIHDWIKQMKVPDGATTPLAERKAREEDLAALNSLRQAKNAPSEACAAAIRRLASSTRGGLLLLSFLNQAPITPEFRRLVVSITRNSPQIAVRDLFERFIPESERIKRLGDTIDRQALLAMKGNAERGKTVFATNPAAQCKTCHKIGPLGESVGPDLSKIGTKYDRATILEHILDPSRTIDQQYVSYLVETKDGQVVTGVVAERTKSAIVVKDVQGKTTTIPSDQVEQLSPQPRSLMPELLLRDLTAQQAADLLEFLAGLK